MTQTQSIGIIIKQDQVGLGIFNKADESYSFLTDSVRINPLFSPWKSTITIEGVSYDALPEAQPLHAGDSIYVYLKIPAWTSSSSAYINLFDDSHRMSLKRNINYESETFNTEEGTNYSSSTSVKNSGSFPYILVLKYRVPDIESGKYLVAYSCSTDGTVDCDGFGYVIVSE